MALETRIKRLEETVCPSETLLVICGPNGEPLPCYCGKPYKLEDFVPPDFRGTVLRIVHAYRTSEKETLGPPCRCNKS